MRMWMLNPKIQCRQHLLGEHNEIHKYKHIFERRWSITNRVFPHPQIEPKSMKKRHDIVAKEMIRRGYKHESPYVQSDLSYLPYYQFEIRISHIRSFFILMNRCKKCQKRFVLFILTLGRLK